MSNLECGEEIDLREFIQVINKRKNIIISTVFITLIFTGIAVFFIPKTYEVKAVVQNGYMNTPIITYVEAATLLKSRDFLGPIFGKLSIRVPQEKDIKKMILIENIKESNYFVLKIKLSDSKLVYLLSQEIINAYLEYGNSIYYSQTNLIKNHIVQLEDLIRKTKIDLEKGQKNSLEQRDISFPIAFPDDKVQMKDLLSLKFQLESQLVTTREFKLIDAPFEPQYPVSPRKGFIIIGSCIFSLLVGMFLAFLTEGREKNRVE